MTELGTCTAEASRVGAQGPLQASKAETSTAAVTVFWAWTVTLPATAQTYGPTLAPRATRMGSLCWLPYPHPGSAEVTYFVTLKILSNRSARRTLIPKEVPGLMAAHTTSKMLPTMTCNGDGFSPVLHAHACVQLSPPACGCLSLQAPAVSLVCSPSHTGHCKGHASRSSCSPRELRRVRRSCCPRSLLLYPDVPGAMGLSEVRPAAS